MKKGLIFCPLVAILLVLLTAVIWSPKEKDTAQVRLSEKNSASEESSYQISVPLQGTDFSAISRTLADKITRELDTFDSMTTEQQLSSSKLWGIVGIQTDTWQECEAATGLSVHNPLESIGWLRKAGYFGMEDAAKHILITANATQAADRKPSDISITAGYTHKEFRITLSATLIANTGSFTTGNIRSGFATFGESTSTTRSGSPVLIVTTEESNNTGYYNGDFFDPTAYWVQDNVFYALRILGKEEDKAEIQATLARLLAEI